MSQSTWEMTWWISAIGILIIWDLAWRGYALWKAAQAKDNIWFIALMLISSAGILPIAYLTTHIAQKRSSA